jgi:hypothetical protein
MQSKLSITLALPIRINTWPRASLGSCPKRVKRSSWANNASPILRVLSCSCKNHRNTIKRGILKEILMTSQRKRYLDSARETHKLNLYFGEIKARIFACLPREKWSKNSLQRNGINSKSSKADPTSCKQKKTYSK